MKKLMILAILFVTALAIIDLSYDDRMKPDETYDFCNRNIVWLHEKTPTP